MSEGNERTTTEEYDSSHGKTTLKDEQQAVNLSEGSNRPPPAETPFKITTRE